MTNVLEKGYTSRRNLFSILERNSFRVSGAHTSEPIFLFNIFPQKYYDRPVSTFEADESESGETYGNRAFNIRIVDGPGHDANYLQQSSRLKEIFEREKIPYVDERDLSRLKLEATTYAESLLRAALELK